MSINEEKETIIDSKANNEGKEQEQEEETKETEEETEEESTNDEKSEDGEESPDALAGRRARLIRKLQVINEKLGMTGEKDTEKTPSPKKTSKKSEGFDWGEKAFLTANGIKGTDEHEFTQKLQKQTGLDLDSLLEDTYFQTKLTEYREQKATDKATPNGTKRANNSSVDTVEYWIAKGELPPASDVELRRKVVNARLKKDQTKGVFYNS